MNRWWTEERRNARTSELIDSPTTGSVKKQASMATPNQQPNSPSQHIKKSTPALQKSVGKTSVQRGAQRKRTLSEQSDKVDAKVDNAMMMDVVSVTGLDTPKSSSKATLDANKRPRLETAMPIHDGSLTTPTKTMTIDSEKKALILRTIQQRLAESDARTLYLRKLPSNTTMSQLKSLCPTSINTRLQSLKHVNRRKNAFVEFKSEAAAEEAAKTTNGKLLADRPVSVELCSQRTRIQHNPIDGATRSVQWSHPSQRKMRDFAKLNLHLSCVPSVATREEIQGLFPQAASVDINLPSAKNGIKTCQVRFANEEDALNAFDTQNGKEIKGTPIIVNFAFKKHLSTRLEKEKKKATNPSLKLKALNAISHVTPKTPQPKQMPAGTPQRQTPKSTGKPKPKAGPMTPATEPAIVPVNITPLGVATKGSAKKAGLNLTPARQPGTPKTPNQGKRTPKTKTPKLH